MIDRMAQNEPQENKDKIFSLLQAVAREIKALLPVEIRADLPTIVGTAHKILSQELEINPNLLSNSNPDSFILGTLSLYLAHKWNQTKIDFLSKEVLSRHFLTLFQKNDRAYTEEDEPGIIGDLPDARLKSILAAAFPDRNVDWQNSSTSDLLKTLAVDGIVLLPFEFKEATSQEEFFLSPAGRFLTQVYDQQKVPLQERKFFVGMYHPESKVILLWSDTSKKTEIHERNHATHEGLLAGNLGHVLNEALTEATTITVIAREKETQASYDDLKSASAYAIEVTLLEHMAQMDSELLEDLTDYYSVHTSEGAKSLALRLITLFGFENYGKLFTVRPGDREVKNLIVYLKNLQMKNVTRNS